MSSELEITDSDYILYKILVDDGHGVELPIWMSEEWKPSYNSVHTFYGHTVEFRIVDYKTYAYLNSSAYRGYGDIQPDALICREKHPTLRNHFLFVRATRAEVREALVRYHNRPINFENIFEPEPEQDDLVNPQHEPTVSDPSPDIPEIETEDRVELWHNPVTNRVEQRVIHVPIVRRPRPVPPISEARIRLRRR